MANEMHTNSYTGPGLTHECVAVDAKFTQDFVYNLHIFFAVYV